MDGLIVILNDNKFTISKLNLVIKRATAVKIPQKKKKQLYTYDSMIGYVVCTKHAR